MDVRVLTYRRCKGFPDKWFQRREAGMKEWQGEWEKRRRGESRTLWPGDKGKEITSKIMIKKTKKRRMAMSDLSSIQASSCNVQMQESIYDHSKTYIQSWKENGVSGIASYRRREEAIVQVIVVLSVWLDQFQL